MIDAGEKVGHAPVVRADLDADGALSDGRQKFVGAHDPGCVLGQSQSFQTRKRKQGGINLTGLKFAQSRFHVAA